MNFFSKIRALFSGLSQQKVVLYGALIGICVIIIGVAIYFQFFNSKSEQIIWTPGKVNEEKEEKEYDKLRNEFRNEFNNSVRRIGQDTVNYKKTDESKEIVHTMYNIELSSQNNYNIKVHIPYINIKGDIADEINRDINNTFGAKVNSVVQSTRKLCGL